MLNFSNALTNIQTILEDILKYFHIEWAKYTKSDIIPINVIVSLNSLLLWNCDEIVSSFDWIS